MSCAPGPPTFRLLDHLVGWDPLDVYRLTDPDDPSGIQLARQVQAGPPAVTSCHGCPTRGWPLAAAAAPGTWPHRSAGCSAGTPAAAGGRSGRRTATPAWPGARTRSPPAGTCWQRPARRRCISGAGRATSSPRSSPGTRPRWPSPRGGAPARPRRVHRPGPLRPGRRPARPHRHRDDRARRSAHHRPGAHRRRDCTIWALTDTGGTLQLWRGERGSPGAFQQATLDDLAAAVDRTSLTVATDQGFCLAEPGPDGDQVTSCFSWDGQPAGPHLPGDATAGDGRPAADHGNRQRPATLPLAPGPRRRRHTGRDQRDGGRRHQRGPHPARDNGGVSPGRLPGRTAEPGRLAAGPRRVGRLPRRPAPRPIPVPAAAADRGRHDDPGRAPDPAGLPAGHQRRPAARRLHPGPRRGGLHRAVPVPVRRLLRGGRPRRSSATRRCSTPAACPTRCCPGWVACSAWRSTPAGTPPSAANCSPPSPACTAGAAPRRR